MRHPLSRPVRDGRSRDRPARDRPARRPGQRTPRSPTSIVAACRGLLDPLVVLRSRARRSPVVRRAARRRVAAFGLAALVAWTVAQTLDHAEQERARWGPTRAVVVATADVEAGSALGVGNTELQDRPVGHLPHDVLTELPEDRRAAGELSEGEVLVPARLAAGSLGAVAASLPAGTVGVTFDLVERRQTLTAGDRVDVHAALAESYGGPGAATTLVAEDAVVVEVGPESVTLAVALDDAGDAASASLSDRVSLVVRGA